jgi:protein SCO1/2
MVSVSINEAETAGDALNAKRLAIESIEKPFPDEKWHFLRGDSESIRKITDATGYRYVRNGNVFDHPLGLIILSPQGKIVRYIVGPEILPIDLSISLMEASSGVVSPTIARVLRYCFSYDPKSHLFVFNILRVSGSAVFLLAGIFIVYLMVSGNKRRTGGGR